MIEFPRRLSFPDHSCLVGRDLHSSGRCRDLHPSSPSALSRSSIRGHLGGSGPSDEDQSAGPEPGDLEPDESAGSLFLLVLRTRASRAHDKGGGGLRVFPIPPATRSS
jgi:hypothetical protein